MSYLRPALKITSTMSKQLITKMGQPQQIKFLSTGVIAKTTCRGPKGRCGIPPIEKKEIIRKEKIVEELGKNLQAPPCIPKGRVNTRFPPLCATHEGIECPQEALRYKYPAYSECRRRHSRERFAKECCYFPPPPCDINLVRDENTK